MAWLEALILGLIQGLAEFLPISSDGHLAVAQRIIAHLDPSAWILSDDVLIDVLLHFGTLVAMLVYYRDVIQTGARGLLGSTAVPPEYQRASLIRVGLLVLVATLPLVPDKLFFMKMMESAFHDLRAVGIGFLITAAALLVTIRLSGGQKGPFETSWLDALLIGIAQAFAPLPGVSRSGLTIAMALALGLNRTWSVGFSLLIAVPAISGAVVFKLKEADPAGLAGERMAQIAVATILAGVLGYLAISWLVRIVRRGWFWYFSVYLIVLGVTVLVIGLKAREGSDAGGSVSLDRPVSRGAAGRSPGALVRPAVGALDRAHGTGACATGPGAGPAGHRQRAPGLDLGGFLERRAPGGDDRSVVFLAGRGAGRAVRGDRAGPARRGPLGAGTLGGASWSAPDAGAAIRGLDPRGLDPDPLPAPGLPAAEVAARAVFRRYRSLLKTLQAEDAEGFAVWAAARFQDDPPPALRHLDLVVALEPPAEDRAVGRASTFFDARCRTMAVALPWDAAVPEVFAAVTPLRDRLLARGFQEVPCAAEPARPALLNAIDGWLFRDRVAGEESATPQCEPCEPAWGVADSAPATRPDASPFCVAAAVPAAPEGTQTEAAGTAAATWKRPENQPFEPRNTCERENEAPPAFEGLKLRGAPRGEGCALVVARQVRDAFEAGQNAEDILVLVPGWDDQAGLIVETLASWGIATVTDDAGSLARVPAVAVLLLALGLPVESWDANQLIRLLRNRLLRPSWPEARAPMPSPWRRPRSAKPRSFATPRRSRPRSNACGRHRASERMSMTSSARNGAASGRRWPRPS